MLLAMPKVVFEMVAFGFEGIVVLVLDFPAGPPSRHNLRHCFLGDLLLGHKGIVVEELAVGRRAGQLTPIDIEGIGRRPQGELGRIPIRMEDQPFGRMLTDCHLVEVFAQLPLRQRLIEGGMRLGLADQDKGEPCLDEDLTPGLVRIQVIAQNGDAGGPIVGGLFADPAFGGRIFTVLFGMPILGGNELRRQRQHVRLPRRPHHRRQHLMRIGGGASGVGLR